MGPILQSNWCCYKLERLDYRIVDISIHNIDGVVRNVTFAVTEKDFQEMSVCQSTIVKLMC